MRQVTLRLPVFVEGIYGGFFLAVQEGYYEEVGLEVEILEGRGSPVTAQQVAGGEDDFGYVDLGAATRLIARDAPIKVIAGIQQVSGVGFVHRPPAIETVEDVLDRIIIAPAGAPLQFLPAVLATEGYTVDDVRELRTVDFAAAGQVFLETENSAYLSNSNSTTIVLQNQDPTIMSKAYRDFGVRLLSFGLITSNELIESDPDLVRDFLAASIRGWEAAVEDPEAARDAIVALTPNLTVEPDIVLGQVEATNELLLTERTEGGPIGEINAEDYQEMITILNQYAELDSFKPAEEYYTNEFLP